MIEKLSTQVIQEIAAGEVIERPASVLKELIENSIDAGASEIRVRYDAGGLSSLEVSDDGKGVSERDFPLVFESHATSKLKSIDDFNSLSTMGFRGEAMSSISAVAHVDFWTTFEGNDIGHRAKMDFGVWQGVVSDQKRVGSQVKVEKLFDRLPVRQKFLKSPQAETRALTQVWRRYALSCPEKKWVLESVDGKKKLSAGIQSAMSRVIWFFDERMESYWFEAKSESHGWKIHFVGLKPRYLQSRRQGLFIDLNRRPIKDRSLEMAVRRAFEGYAEQPQNVVGWLSLEGDPGLFDVNVHPTKTEVRFLEKDKVFSAVVAVIRKALEAIHKLDFETQIQGDAGELKTPTRLEFGKKPLTIFAWPSSKSKSINYVNQSNAEVSDGTREVSSKSEEFKNEEEPSQDQASKLGLEEAGFQYIGSIERTYLIAKKAEQLFLFDQHALHERVLYEELKRDFEKNKKVSSQRLLFPQALDWADAEELLENEQILERLGFEVRAWGEGKIQLLAAPMLLKRDPAAALKEIAIGKESAEESILRLSLATLACHAAIRAHDAISDQEAQKILDQFESDDALGHCPHGRPTFVRLGSRELEKFFHRV